MMSSCKNCGHESHCGITLQEPLQTYFQENVEKGKVIVCTFCRCELCEVKSKPSWPGPGV